MNNNNYAYNQPVEIDLIELFKYLIKKWKIFAIAMLAGAVLALAYNYYQVSKWQPQMLSDYVAAEIGEDDIRGYDMNQINQAVKYKKSLVDYDESASARMALQMDPLTVYTYSASYLISADNYSIDTVRTYYYKQFFSAEGKALIKSAIGSDCTDVDFEDLFAVSSYDLYRADTTEDGSATPATAQMDITYYSSEEASAQSIAEIVDSIIQTAAQNTSGTEEIALLSQNTSFGYSAAIQNLRNSSIDTRNGYLKNITSAETNFSDEEIYYVDYLSGEEYQVNETAEMHIVKYAVIGAFIFACIVGVYYVCVFVFGKQVKTADDVERMGAGHVLAQYPQNTAEYIASAMKALEGQSILVSVDKAAGENQELLNLISKADSRVEMVGGLDVDPAAVTKAKNADVIVIVIQLWKTDFDSLRKQLTKAQGLGKTISGFIVIE